MWYKFDIHKFGEQMLPPILRGRVILAFIKAFLAPLVWLYNQFRALRESSVSRLAGGGQGLSLVEALRQAYNTPEGDIYIVDAEHKERYLYYKHEGQKDFVVRQRTEGEPPIRLYHTDEGRIGPDYYIYVPDFLEKERDNILRLVEQYKPAGRKYEIIYYPYE